MGLDQDKLLLGQEKVMNTFKEILKLRVEAANKILPKYVTDSLARERVVKITKEAENSNSVSSFS